MITQFLIYLFAKTPTNAHPNLVRSKYAYLEGMASVILNIILFVLNLVAGLLSGSIALIVDSFHTLSDVLGSAVIMVSSKLFIKPETKDHPFGHGRSEQIATIIIAVLLGVAGFEFLKSSIERLLHPEPLIINWFIFSVVLFTIITKEWNARFAFYLGKKVKSDMLIASGHHHRSDAWSSLVVLVALAGNFLKLPILDAIVGIILSLMLFYVAYEIIKKGSKDILGTAPDQEDLNKITEQAIQIKGVIGVHDIIIHNYGNKKVATCHIEMPLSYSLDQAHTLAETVEDTLLEKLGIFLTVHIDPTDTENPLVQKISEQIAQIINQNQLKIKSFHDVRIIKNETSFNLVFDASISQLLSESEKKELNQFFEKEIQRFYPEISKISVQFEPLFSY